MLARKACYQLNAALFALGVACFFEGCHNMLNLSKVSDRNRSKLQIIAEILGHLRIPAGKANIMSHCNMSTAQSGEYLNLMTSSNLIHLGAYAGKVTYQRTKAGLEFIELYRKMALLLDAAISSPFLV
jgi:predicted transcriptional regulator